MLARTRNLVIALVWLATGCASNDLRVGTSHDPLTAFPSSATFGWDRERIRMPSDDRIARLDLPTHLERILADELGARGYRLVDSGPTDFRISYQLTTRSVMSDKPFATASLSIRMNDGKERQVWVGFAIAEIHVDLPQPERSARLRNVVQQMLENFPPRSDS